MNYTTYRCHSVQHHTLLRLLHPGGSKCVFFYPCMQIFRQASSPSACHSCKALGWQCRLAWQLLPARLQLLEPHVGKPR